MKRITQKYLLRMGTDPTCEDLARFNRRWPKGADVTLTNALRAVDAGINLDYFAVFHIGNRRSHIFQRAASAAYNEWNKRYGRAETERRKTRIDRRYQRAIAPVLVAVLRGKKPKEATY